MNRETVEIAEWKRQSIANVQGMIVACKNEITYVTIVVCWQDADGGVDRFGDAFMMMSVV